MTDNFYDYQIGFHENGEQTRIGDGNVIIGAGIVSFFANHRTIVGSVLVSFFTNCRTRYLVIIIIIIIILRRPIHHQWKATKTLNS